VVQPITAGQEITFDYAMRNYSVEHFAAHCQCASPRCRDRITGWKDLPAERKADYRGFVAPYLTDIDNGAPPHRPVKTRDPAGSASTGHPALQRRTRRQLLGSRRPLDR
jgi:uncharacterized protein